VQKKEFPFEKQINEKSAKFIKKLCDNDIFADIIPDSLREYSVKIKVNDFGTVNLYYKPTENSYKITLQEVKHSPEVLQIIWNELNNIDDENIYANKGFEIDVDGSYRNGITSYGVVVRKDGKMIKELSGTLDQSEVEGSHQVAGEIKAVKEAVIWCRENKINDVTLYYDYNGLEKWARGKWKTKKNVSRDYADFMKTDNIKIKWIKIESHTGKKWNEYADRLAMEAINGNIKN
jgi:ribonuclease H-related protein